MPSPPSRVSVLKAASDLCVVKSSGQLCILILLGQFATFRAVDQLFPCHIPHSWRPVYHTLLDFLLPPWLLLLSLLCSSFPFQFLNVKMSQSPVLRSLHLQSFLWWPYLVSWFYISLSVHPSIICSQYPPWADKASVLRIDCMVSERSRVISYETTAASIIAEEARRGHILVSFWRQGQ